MTSTAADSSGRVRPYGSPRGGQALDQRLAAQTSGGRPGPKPLRSVHDEQFGTSWRTRSVGFLVIGDLIARARRQCEDLSAFEFSHQLAFQDEKNVPLGAPVICEITRRILNHPHTHLTESAGSPAGRSTLRRVLARGDPLSISDHKGNTVHLHSPTLAPHCRRSVLSGPGVLGLPDSNGWRRRGPPPTMTGAESLCRLRCHLLTPASSASRRLMSSACSTTCSFVPVHTR